MKNGLNKVTVLTMTLLVMSPSAFCESTEKNPEKFAAVDAMLAQALKSTSPEASPTLTSNSIGRDIVTSPTNVPVNNVENSVQNTQSNTTTSLPSATSSQPMVAVPINAIRTENTNYSTELTARQSVSVWNNTTQKDGIIPQPGLQPGALNSPAVLATRFTEIPSGTIIELGQSLDIPANKSGIFFDGGRKVAAISDSDQEKLLQLISEKSVGDIGACALTSSRSNLHVRGVAEGSPSQLEVDKLAIVQVMSTGRYVAQIQFKEKLAKNTDQSVSVSMYCGIPAQTDFKSGLTIKNLVDGFEGGFSVKLSMLAEI